jgi:hypothetical protein
MEGFTPEQQAAIRKVIVDEVARARIEASRPGIVQWVQGGLASWTVRAGGLLVVLPELMEALAPLVTEQWGAEVWKRFVQVIGVLMILLRAKTTQPLPERGVQQ